MNGKTSSARKSFISALKKVLLQDLRVINSPDLNFLALGYFCSLVPLNHNAISFRKYLFVRYTVEVIIRTILFNLLISLNLHLIGLNSTQRVEFSLHKHIHNVIMCNFFVK